MPRHPASASRYALDCPLLVLSFAGDKANTLRRSTAIEYDAAPPFSRSPTHRRLKMPRRLPLRDRSLLELFAAPLVLIAYAILAFGVFRLGCAPAFADVDFFGVGVTVFLLGALTVAALVLILFAGLHLPSVFHRADATGGQTPRRRTALVLISVALVLVSFLLAGAWGFTLLGAPCP
jgi:hypothetical protein